MSDTSKQVRKNGFTATVLISYTGKWECGSCQSPPLGTSEEMERYADFISTVTQVCDLLNIADRYNLTQNEQKYLLLYTK